MKLLSVKLLYYNLVYIARLFNYKFYILAPWRVLVLIQVGVATLRRSKAHALKTKRPAQTKRNIGKERAAALDRLPTRPLFLLPMKSCVVKTFVAALFLFWLFSWLYEVALLRRSLLARQRLHGHNKKNRRKVIVLLLQILCCILCLRPLYLK